MLRQDIFQHPLLVNYRRWHCNYAFIVQLFIQNKRGGRIKNEKLMKSKKKNKIFIN